ncbi:alpha/beta fold hydrolase [Arthrobacter sp. NPDC058097]|uniref:alpha/beta fold hydrolase n=1 Tax=Arthrobacter sp. NPDC058097 TaxID=3346340 RepID=UPI0036DC0DDC
MSVDFAHDDVVKALSEDREFRLASRNWTAMVRINRGARKDDLVLIKGQVASFGPATDDTAHVTLSGPEEGWERLLHGDPTLQFAFMTGEGGFSLEGDLVQHLAPYGAAIRRFLKILARVHGYLPENAHISQDPFQDTDVAVGRYVYYDVDGIRYRVYYEEAGEGIPLLLQHTAGADNRQWRHFLADPELQKTYRMIAYDLPYHGKSLPPLGGTPWWEAEYAPSKEDLLKRIVGFKQALGLDRPLFMGVSVGGQLAPDILAHYPEHFRGAVSINGWYHPDAMAGFSNEPFHHPQISSEYWAGLMYEATSPLAAEQLRRESAWIYASNGPAVYKGDNEYYAHGHDLRVDGHLINTANTPLYAVAGEFDPAAHAPGGSPEIAKNIPGAKYQELKGLSHFAMSDDPVRFHAAIKPILADVVAQSEANSAATAPA